MKIEEINIADGFPGSAPRKIEQANGDDFSKLLAKAVQEEAKPTEPAPLEPAPMVSAPSPAPASPAMVQVIGGLLDALDSYARALGDDSVSLKQIEPLARDLERKAHKLSERLEEDSSGPLAEMARQTITQAQVEAFKFQRGDYV